MGRADSNDTKHIFAFYENIDVDKLLTMRKKGIFLRKKKDFAVENNKLYSSKN